MYLWPDADRSNGTIDPEYGKPTHIRIRTAVFIALGCFSTIAIAHEGYRIPMVLILWVNIYLWGSTLCESYTRTALSRKI
ncbi:hypothetical protein D9757_007243 [Collybiopsis confluens]|uniref:Uncharacterized protein n=1 Tax=Collybiopsis confluens TaxID=2823264 RepID=A0A8H5HAS0_9AGAR|nr:hypothetical protein D9757_007243 [Collybiopsis confluens]